MQADIHPTYYKDATITCACGAKHKAGSTVKEIKTDVCSKCHPFFTGRQDHLIDTTGRVDRFRAKRDAAKQHQQDTGQLVEEAEKEEVKTEAPADETTEDSQKEASANADVEEETEEKDKEEAES
ncbi:50S ribosomal protein L31 [Candidatus Peregrinibacteria bacterium]|jgi:large subunit ribosomal protein L31|nr:50S ribosomal protein L31 [Candidatus Peregrinibacteria bacterium]